MNRKASKVIAICEDFQHRVFLYRMLKQVGFTKYDIDIDNAPPGRGSAEQFVRERYPIEVKEYRRRVNSLGVRLIVMIDADSYTFQDRQQQLAQSLSDAGVERRDSRECIALLIPRRNIETWIHSLFGTPVDETTAYSKFRNRESECQPAVDQLLEYLRGEVPTSLPDSLRRGCKELKQRLFDCQSR